MRFLLTLFTLILTVASVAAQKVKAKPRYAGVRVEKIRFPVQSPLGTARSYSRSVSTGGSYLNPESMGSDSILRAAVLPSYGRVPSGDIHIELIPDRASHGEITGETTRAFTKWSAYVPVYFSTELRIVRAGGEVLYRERFGPVQEVAPTASLAELGTLLRGNKGRDVGGAAAEPDTSAGPSVFLIVNEATQQPFGYRIDTAKLIDTRPEEYIDYNWGDFAPRASDFAARSLAPAIAARLAEFGYGMDTVKYAFFRLAGDHPLTERFNAATDALVATLERLHVDMDIRELQGESSEPLAVLTEVYRELEAADDKQDVKVRRAALRCVLSAHMALDQYTEALAFLDARCEADRNHPEWEIEATTRAQADQLANSPFASSYDPPLADTYVMGAGEEDASRNAERFGLLGVRSDAELVAARPGEQEMGAFIRFEPGTQASGRLHTIGRIYAVANPPVPEGEAVTTREQAERYDPRPYAGKTYRVLLEDEDASLTSMDFCTTKALKIKFDGRIFERYAEVDKKTLGILVSEIANDFECGDPWYELVYAGPRMEILRRIENEYSEAVGLLSGKLPNYAFRIGADVDVEAKALRSKIDRIKDLDKALDCPAVSAFIDDFEGEVLMYEGHLVQIAEIYEGACGSVGE